MIQPTLGQFILRNKYKWKFGILRMPILTLYFYQAAATENVFHLVRLFVFCCSYFKTLQKILDYINISSNKKKCNDSSVWFFLITIQPTSVESERVFSAACVICTKIRSRLNDKSIDELAFYEDIFIHISKFR
jgi:hAT family protein